MDEHDRTDLAAVALLRADVPAPTDDALTVARLRLTAAMGDAPLAQRRSIHRARYARRATIGVAAAVALGLGAYALTGQDPSTGTGSTPPSVRAVAPAVTPGRPAPVRPTPAPHYVNAAQLLDAASTAALRSTVTAGQYLHTRTHALNTTTVDDPPEHGAYLVTESRTEQWAPASTTDPGYEHDVNNISTTAPTAKQRRYLAQLPGNPTDRSDAWYRIGADGSTTPIYPAGGTEPGCAGPVCSSLTAWDGPTRKLTAMLPTSVAALRANLFTWARAQHADATKYGKATRVASIALRGVGFVLGSGYATAQLRSALFQVAKSIPGITLVGSMTNYDGVRGLAVSTTDPFDVQQNLIFAKDGSAFIGERDVVVHPSAQYHLKAGRIVTWTAVTTDVTGTPALPKGARTER